jgi:hypothetical protein
MVTHRQATIFPNKSGKTPILDSQPIFTIKQTGITTLPKG